MKVKIEKIVLAISFLSTCAVAQATNWEMISSVGEIGDIGFATFIDLDSVQKVSINDLEPVTHNYAGKFYISYHNKNYYRQERNSDFYTNSIEYVSCSQWRFASSPPTMTVINDKQEEVDESTEFLKPKKLLEMDLISSSTINSEEAHYVCMMMGHKDAKNIDFNNSNQVKRLKQNYPEQFEEIVKFMITEY